MPLFCLSFRLHHPRLLRRVSFFDIGKTTRYEDDTRNAESLQQVRNKGLLTIIQLLEQLALEYRGDFRFALSASGVFLELCETFQPDLIKALHALSSTGCVEWINEPAHDSFAALASTTDFKAQCELHARKIKTLFDADSPCLRNTALIFNNRVACDAGSSGKQVVMINPDYLPNKRTRSSRVYEAEVFHGLKLLPTQNLTFQSTFPSIRPPSSPSIISWLIDIQPSMLSDNTVSAFSQELRALLKKLIAARTRVIPPAMAVASCEVEQRLDIAPPPFGNRGYEGLESWTGDAMQSDAFHSLYRLEDKVRNRNDPAITRTWRMLQESDHLLAMSSRMTSPTASSAYGTPYDAYINFMNILTDFDEHL